MVEIGARAASLTGKTGWRGKGFKRPDPEPDVAAETVAAEEATEAPAAVPDEDAVLEQEPDDADVAGLVDHDPEDSKER